ncbi:hypothetical protein BBP00_00004192 [Phytophthora kernoviae]|uniref:Midasin n=1 Tax=Phytophthora kernoviae TaxID=325452 RepID=A0A3F2RTX6_9STRA|nr:hypothetical protein BBP00_00004192 [Phytophthora kernoviae]
MDVDGHASQRDADAVDSIVSIYRMESGLSQVLASGSDRLRLHPTAPVLTSALPDDDVDAAVSTKLQALATCLVDEELRVLVVKHLRPFLLDLMVRLMDPAITLYERDTTTQQFKECSDSMKRSEIIALTLAELLMFLPSTNTLVQQYFDTAPCFFTFADVAAGQKQQSDETLERVRRIAYTAYRLMCQRPTELSTQWNWTPFFPLSFHEDTYVRWYAARATALILRMDNAQQNDFLGGLHVGEKDAVSGEYPAVRQIELARHLEDATRQEKLIALSVYQQQDEITGVETRSVPLHDSLKNIFGVVVPTSNLHQQRQAASPENPVSTDPLVPTSSTKRNLQSLAIALGLKRPVLVAGPGGCGKTATIRELARLSGNDDMVELHLDDQIDSKTLLGSYVCTDVPGEFTWQPGALTTAVLAGRWVVIEDIDRAPFEVLAALMPLLETREMVLPGRGEMLVAHSNFQIFGTTTQGHQMPKGFQESVWTSVNVAPLADDEIEQIMLTRFVKIPPQVVSKIMITYNAVSGKMSEEIGGPVQLWKETRRNYGRDFCLRDLLKWCKRIYRFCYYAAGNTQDELSSSHDYITEDERMHIVVEALDVFCAGIRDVNTRSRSACALGAIWDVQAEKIEYYLEQRKPHVTFSSHEVEFGRVHLPTLSQQAQLQQGDKPATSSVVMTGHVLRLLEKLAAIVATCEPALLIGETGCGKTTVIQHMAAAMGQRLIVQNLNIQSDSSDLVGGFKPVEIHLLARPLYIDFVDLFTTTFSQKSNTAFLNVVRIALEHKDWKKLVKGMRKAVQMAAAKLQNSSGRDQDEVVVNNSNKMIISGTSGSVLESRWDTFEAELGRFERQKEQAESHFAFSFVEGVLVKALRDGHWVLLDEINLASSDTLERISTLLEHETSAFSLTERGDVEIIRPHPNFRLFGAMNPSTDVGKKDLPPSLRNRFTEIYVDECVNPSDLQMVVHHQFKEIAGALVPETVEFYLEARKQAELRLSDGARHKPRYSLRTLSQALHITRILIQRGYGTSRAMFEGFCSSFCTQLEMDSRQYLETLIKKTFAKTIKSKELTRTPPCPGGSKKTDEFVEVSSYWVRKGDFQPPRDDSLPDPVTSRRKFVLTKSVNENLRHVSRAALIGKYPVLLQGPTSAGKTSLIAYLAARIGQKCVRINNHEHTDIQEYLGSYVSDSNGKLTFKEGVLVEAVRKGWWIILDELNLAPSEVLEALNRLLDDNREIFLPETQETVKPHPKFMLFATQNPPGLYGGRKVLSRAFRNRFLEIQVDEVASSELQTILQERSSLPPSYCGILIDIMRQLQLVRQQSSIFAGKSGFITTRDLLRWAERRPATKQALAEEGYCLLAERLRKDEEKQVVKQVLEQKCNVKIDLDALYYSGKPRESNLLNENGEIERETVWGTTEQFGRVQAMVEQAIVDAATGKSASDGEPKAAGNAAGLEKISVTKSLRRLFALVGRCLQNQEPVLLVGETGCGKTTVCQLYSLLFSQPLHILNCHQHTETSDFLGCLRPVRGKEKIAQELEEALVRFLIADEESMDENEIDQRRAAVTSMGIAAMLVKFEKARGNASDDESSPQKLLAEQIDALKRRFQSIFEWADGPLVESMKNGDLILIDEVNLAEDAVLERLNSVLEPSRTLLLAEKGGDQVEEIMAHEKWRVMATMNPGGDFGKRELSPALRNRFTEIWVPAISDLDDIATIIRDRLVGPQAVVQPPRALPAAEADDLSSLCGPILNFVQTFNEANGGIGGCGGVTLRDILSWINFIMSVVKKQNGDASLKTTAWTAFVQGAALAILDGLGLGSDKALHTALKARDDAYQYLLALIPQDDQLVKEKVLSSLNATKISVDDNINQLNSFSSDGAAKDNFGISPFLISRGPDLVRRKPAFSLKAPTTMSNLYRVLRAMQVSRPIILEGSPGVGKTSLISALAAASGHRLVRINLSEQTDISDLFGSDLPAASNNTESQQSDGGNSNSMFEWCDGVFLRALKAGDWVLLDELNLASQSVLEGLNSCLDHRGSVYIPELDREFECPPSFRVFAAQNPLRQGGGRKGLPKSFLNRFTRVFVETLHEQDLIHIASSMYPTLHCPFVGVAASTITGQTLLERMIGFNRAVHEDTMVNCRYGRLGAPWEFNLRDVFRFCDLLKQQVVIASEQQLQALSYYVNFIYVERMRSGRDRALISRRFEEFFGVKPMNLGAVSLRMSAKFVEIGNALLRRRQKMSAGHVAPPLFNFLLKPMEALVHCVNMSWPALLVGSPASGKTSSVRLLAALSGNTLHELGMSAGTDATELLGCFEQVDVGRKLRGIKQKLQVMYENVLQQLMLDSASFTGASQKKKSTKLKQANRLSSAWWALTTREKYFNENASPSNFNGKGKKQKAKKLAKGQLDDVVVDLLNDVVRMLQKATIGDEDGLSALTSLSNEIDLVVQLSKSSSIASCFEWVDGTLIQAMEKGEWVLLDNVNFCSSSVLDRLNALMETGGEMLINECGIINGKLRVIKPHKNFRIFLAMDPQFGEVSRAMRNRCVEIALAGEDAPRLDLIKIPLACGIPGFALSQAFQVAHESVVSKLKEHAVGMKYSRINRRHLENWSLLASAELSRGVQPLNAIAESFQRVYGDGLLALLDLSQEILELFLSAFTASQEEPQRQRVLPAITAPSTFVLCQQSESFILQRDVAYLEYVVLSSHKPEESGVEDLLLSRLTPESYAIHKYHADRADAENELIFLVYPLLHAFNTFFAAFVQDFSELVMDSDNADSHVDLLSEEDSRIGKDAPILLFDMKESALLVDRMVTFQLSPLLEHALARQELEAIAELVRVSNMYQLNKSSSAQMDYRAMQKVIAGVLKLLEDIIEELLRLGLRDPACFYAYQDIVCFNQMDMVSLEVFDTRRKLRKANKRLPVSSTDVEDHGQVIGGYPRLFQAVQSAVVLKSISEVDLEESSCATSEAQMRVARLEKIKSHYTAQQVDAAKKMTNVSVSFVKELFVSTTSESFLAQLSKKFGESFRDVVEPVAAAIYCVKEGVALLSWSIYKQLKEKSFKEQQKEALALALVQFPSSLQSTSHGNTTDFSWRGIQLMLQTVGTPATSILFGGGVANKRRVEVALLDVALAKMEFLFRVTVMSSRTNRALDSAVVDTALGSSKALFDLFLTKWQEQKEREEQKRKEEEELFKYKVRQLDIETEEELLEKEYRDQFPDYSDRDFQAFFGPEQTSTAGIEESGLSAAADMDMLITDKIMQRLCETHVKLYAETSNSEIVITKDEIVNAFARAFSLAVKMRKSLNATASNAVERAVVSSGVYAASLVQARLGSSVGAKKTVPSFQALSSDYIRGVDFHRDPLVKEVVLVAEPLQQLMVKVQSLLAMWPDHAILQQIVLIADRIRNFEISSPLVRTLTGVELLLRKAQEWEAYAAKAYSISDELGTLSSLVTRWRKLELYSWPHLLYVKEKQHRLAAQKTWISMYSLLTAQFESDEGVVTGGDANRVSPSNMHWLHLNHLSQWLFTPLTESTTVQQSANEQREFMNKLFETLDAYVRSCTIGQYETRLLVVYSFCAQLFMEIWSSSDLPLDSAAKSSKYALANMLYHLYRYYAQHLGYLERQWSGLKAPIQRKLMEFVKICRWDEQTYYSLAESAEKSHRKLMKFVRNYDAVLTVSMQTVIDASTDSGITKEGGFVGIHSTKAELAGLDDGVVVPKDIEHQPTDSKDAQECTNEGEVAEGENSKKPKAVAEEESQEIERSPVLRLIHVVANNSEVNQDSAMLQNSSYAEKLPTLSKRIAKYTQKDILSLEQVERRQHVRDVCEDLCETIFYRMFKLQNATGLPKGAKKKALIDLLGELKAQGMAYHRLQLPAEQQHIQQLFELDVPDVENCLRVDNMDAAVDSESLSASANASGLKEKKTRGKKKSKQSGKVQQSNIPEESLVKNSPMWLWQRADGYYYRFLGQLASLRYSAVTSFSHDLSTSETDRMSGYAENMLFSMLQQRQILHATSLSHEKLVDGLATLKLMKEFKNNYLSESNDGAVVVDSKVASEWQVFQQSSLVSLRRSLRELEISVTQILQQSSEASSTVMEVRQLFQRIFERCDVIHKSFTGRAGLTQSLGVPAIPHRAINASEDAGSDAAMVAFARPSKRVHGVSPVVSRTVSAGNEVRGNVLLPVAIDVLKSNSTCLGEIQALLVDISAAFGSVTTQSGLNDFIAEYADIIRDDCNFQKTLRKKIISLSHGDQKVSKQESAQALSEFSCHYDKLVETVLVSIQDLTKMAKEGTPTEDEDEDSEERSLRNELATLSTMVKDSRVNHIASQLATLLNLLETQYAQLASTHSDEWRHVFEASLSLVERLEPVLIDIRGISRQLLVDFLVAHKSVMKLDFVLVRIFRNLFQHGFCRTDEEQQDEEGEGNGKMQFQDDVEGTGMGEGEGKKDVSHEIEDEEQLLGLQGEQQEEQEPPSDEKPDDTGLEMQNDFEGTMQDVPDDEKEDDDDQNEDEEEELDREMGDFDQDDENVIDEKMWGEDSDDDEDNIDKEKEKFEDDSKVEGEALEDEVRGKDGDEDKPDSKKDDEKPKPQPDQPDEKGADEDNGGGEDDGDEKMDEEVNDDFEDKYEDHHDVDPQDREDGHGDDEGEEEHGDDLPEDMQLDNDGDDDDEDADAEGDNPDDENMDAPNDLEDDTANDDATGEDTTADGNDEEDAEEENEEPLDNAVQLGGGGLEDEPEQVEEKDEDETEQTEAPEASQEEQATSAVAGTQSKDGQDELEAEEQSAEDQEMEDANSQDQDQEQSKDNSNSNRAQQQSSSNDQDEQQEWKPQSQVASNPEQERPREKRRDRREPNPYRNAQEAQEHWKKRVEMVEPSEDKESDNNRSDKEEKATEMTTAEFVDDDEDMEDVMHALAPADENQIMNQPRTDEEEEDVEKKEEEDKNSGAGATAMEVDDEDELKKDAKDKEEEDKLKPVKQEPKRELEASEDSLTTQAEEHKLDEQKEKPEDAAGNGDHQLLDDDADQALPSKLRDLDLSNHIQDQEDGDEEEAQKVKLLSPDEVAALRDELDTFIAHWSSQSEQERGADLWAKYTALTAGASQRLCEQLRLVLEPMLRAKLEGDFRTGKRINMRKVIPYIASQFRKDKIWLRRTRPSKRQYQVMLAIDDSESMADNHAGRLALEALATLCKGMTQLEVGELSVVKFGEDLELLHAFDTPFTDDAGSRLIGRFGFQQKKTNMVQTLDTILQLLETAKQLSATASSAVEFTQIVFLISDGRFDSDGRVRIRKLIETALERQQLIVLLIVDQGAAEGEGSAAYQQTSILDTQSVTFEKGKVRMVPYLESYPFPYYVLLPTSAMLPEILSDSLRQWFEMLQAKS